jgi:Tol biopolymer transport system component
MAERKAANDGDRREEHGMKAPGEHGSHTLVALVLLVVLAALALSACGGKGGTATSSPSTSQSGGPLPAPTVAGTIAFERVVTRGLEGNGDIYTVNADGTRLKQLTSDPGWEESPSWSPDGSRIAWVVNRDIDPKVEPTFDYHPTPTIWVMNVDGSGKVQITTGPVHGDHPTWSPDGTRIAFLRYWPQKEAICVMNADGSGLRQVTPELTTVLTGYGYEAFKWYVSPTWGSDGRIYYAQVDHLLAVKPDGTGRVRLAQYRSVGGRGQKFGLSPNARSLAVYTFTADKHLRVVIVPTLGAGKKTTLLDDVSRFVVADDLAFSWAPDGHALALATRGSSDSGSRLYIVNADGSGLSAVPGITSANDPAWRPQ